MKGAQLPLAVLLRESASFESFYPGPNQPALSALRAGGVNVFLYGPVASGKTHLLQATARARNAAYLPLAQLAASGPALLDGYSDAAALCIDDAHSVLAQRDWCLPLLRVLDALAARGAAYAIAATAPPERLTIALPDLRTRLTACAIFGLQTLEDVERASLLRERAHARGLHMPDEVSRWLLNHLPRDTGSLLHALDQLDAASLSAQRRLTLPFTQSVLAAPAHAAARTAPD